MRNDKPHFRDVKPQPKLCAAQRRIEADREPQLYRDHLMFQAFARYSLVEVSGRVVFCRRGGAI